MDFLFDIGNVIVGVDFFPSLQRLIPAGTENPETRLKQVIERKDAFEAGNIEQAIYFPWVAQTLGYNGPLEKLIDAWLDIFTPNQPMWSCIEQLSQEGHRLILFSNINNPHKEYLLENYPIFQHFTGGIFSYQTGYIKPESEIYQIAIKQYQLDPQNTAYIDDLPGNIQSGQHAGFQCHQYNTNQHDNFLKWLNQTL